MEYLEKKTRKPNPKEKSNLVSNIFFIHTFKLFWYGFKRGVCLDDLYEVIPSLKSKRLGDEFEHEWKKRKQRKTRPTLIYLFLKCYGLRYFSLSFAILLMRLITIGLRLYMSGKFVSCFQSGQKEFNKNVYFYGFVVVLASLIEYLGNANYFIQKVAIEIQVRTAVCSLIYRKILKLTSMQLEHVSVGPIVTMITKDIYTIELFIDSVNEMCIGVIRAIVTCGILYGRIGLAALVPVLTFSLVVPFQIYLGMLTKSLKLKMLDQSGKRLHITNEILYAIRVIKVYVWEQVLKSKTFEYRKKEMHFTFKIFFLRFVIYAISLINRNVTFCIMVVCYVLLGNKITSEIIYFAVSSYDSISWLLFFNFPYIVYQSAQSSVACNRINNFLNMKEVQAKTGIEKTNSAEIVFDNFTMKIKEKIICQNVSLHVKKGLTLLMGPSGCGKTYLLETLLGEYQPSKGNINVEGRISYASQKPWLFPSSLRQNILFGEKYDEKRYKEVLKVCDLNYDFKLFQNGDSSIVESYGANLSKGQQSRLNLARAIYRDCDIYLLDDCLATLDIQDKLVIMVTHNKKFIKEASYVLAFDNGNLIFSEVDYSSMNKEEVFEYDTHSMVSPNYNDNEEDYNEKTDLLLSEKSPSQDNIYNETNESGTVAFHVYKKYMKLGGGYWVVFLIICLYAGVRGTNSYLEKNVSIWLNIEEQLENMKSSNLTNTTKYEELFNKRIKVMWTHGIMILTTACLAPVAFTALFQFSRRISVTLHKLMMNAVINAPIQFFDKHAVGSILNRFSKDLINISEIIPFIFHATLTNIFNLLGGLYLIISVQTEFLIPAAFLILFFLLVRYFYLPTGRDLKRLEAASTAATKNLSFVLKCSILAKSPVVGYLHATLEGLTTIKSCSVEETLRKEFDEHQDLYTSASYSFQCCFQTLALYLDLVFWAFITVIFIKFMIIGKDTPASSVGLAVFQCFILSLYITGSIRHLSEIDNYMTSVERTLEYAQIKQENKQGISMDKWRQVPKIEFENVNLVYDNSKDFVLKNINFVVKPMEKIGIVGRTGAGKSSLVSLLFRLYDFEGKILINGVDIKTLTTDSLRDNIAIVPQTPVIFTGTIRHNIDPMGKYTDEEIWNVLRTVVMTNFISSLEREVSQDDAYFSIGLKQLLCLARAIIRKPEIVVLDEVTAYLDSEYQNIISQVIKKEFTFSVVFLVTHNPEFMLECDKVMILNKGEIVEYGAPLELLNNKNGVFYKLVKKA